MSELMDQFRLAITILGGLVVVSVILGIIFLVIRSRKASRLDQIAAMDLNLSKIQLTPEERAKIREAQARRIQQTQLAAGARAPTPEQLLFDPLVLSLQDQAKAAKMAQAADLSPEPLGSKTHTAAETDDHLPPLPPDVQRLADQGLITAEEALNIRKRLADNGSPS